MYNTRSAPTASFRFSKTHIPYDIEILSRGTNRLDGYNKASIPTFEPQNPWKNMRGFQLQKNKKGEIATPKIKT